MTLASLPPWIIDILGIIAYARRHADILEHLIKNYRASSKSSNSTFDLLGMKHLSSRQRTTNKDFQHSPDTPYNCELEWRLWAALLKAEPGTWLHYPLREFENSAKMPAGLSTAVHHLASHWGGDPRLRTSSLYVEYMKALKLRDVVPDVNTIACFLSVTGGSSINFTRGGPFVPIAVAAARAMLDLFPLRNSLSARYRGSESAMVARPITQWPMDNPDRLVVMEMLLEQGLAVDGRTSELNQEPLGPQAYVEGKFDTCLMLAAHRGDTDMVDLLLKYGPKTDIKDARDRTAAQRARENGHIELRDYLASL